MPFKKIQMLKISSIVILLALFQIFITQKTYAQNDSSEKVFFNVTDKGTRNAIDIVFFYENSNENFKKAANEIINGFRQKYSHFEINFHEIIYNNQMNKGTGKDGK
ncbi:hypothetical protein ACKWTF_005013 [Chironomus riparius]